MLLRRPYSNITAHERSRRPPVLAYMLIAGVFASSVRTQMVTEPRSRPTRASSSIRARPTPRDASRGSQRSHSGRAQGGVGMKDLDGRQRPCRRVIYVPEQQVVPFISEEPPRLRARRSRTGDGTEGPLPPRRAG